ncbi:universal stress protein [Pectinatus sottacetonis]|uniref:universal stress protein n=1 Tax=Pectinatus sottacetonis TaxID=1002795 RepID=UPI0018C5CE1C|nr:universal stress protein [Pectinatus sottacetonis]
MDTKNFLVAVDGSENSMIALQQAIEIAEKFKAKLYVIYVKNRNVPVVDSYLLEELIESNNRYSKAILDNAVKKVPDSVDVEGIMEIGDPADQILKLVKEKSIDMVIIGSRGLGTIEGKIFGSVSQKVIQDAKCCVLVCKKESKLF